MRILRAMRDFRVIWYDKATTAIGCKRVSVRGGQVHLHQLTPDGWEDRDLDESAADLMRAARAEGAPGLLAHVEVAGWTCDFAWVDAGRPYRETWWQFNSVGEPVRRRAEDVPLSVKCAVLAEFTAR